MNPAQVIQLSPAKKKVLSGLLNSGAYITNGGFGASDRYRLYIKKPKPFNWTHSTVRKQTMYALLTDGLVEETDNGTYGLSGKGKVAINTA